MQQLKELVAISKNFQTAVNLRLDREDADKFREYIPTSSSAALLRQFFENILQRKGKSASVLIGPYGKGKSHLLLVLLALLEQQYPEVQEEVLEKIGKIDPSCAGAARKVMKKGPYLTALVSDSGGSMNTAFLLALREALERGHLPELMPESYFGEAVKCIERWKKEFPETYLKLNSILENSSSYLKRGETEPAKQLEKELKAFREEALRKFQQIYPQLTAGTNFVPLINMDASVLYQQVNRKLCREHGYQGIYVVFDEFSKYLEGHDWSNSGADMKVLQDLCELANASQSEDFFITFVAHKSLREYNNRLHKDLQDQFRGIEGRLQEYLFVASARNNFDLIGSVLQKTEVFEQGWKEFSIQEETAEFIGKTYELGIFRTQFSWEEYEKIVVRGCFPLTPLAAVLLLNLSEKIAQNERTLFTFLAGGEPNSLYHLIHGKRKIAAGYCSASVIYDYFSPVLRELNDEPEVHNEWLKAEYALKQTEQELEREIIKIVAVLQIAGNRQELPVTCRNIALAAGKQDEPVEKAVAALTEQKLLVWRSKLGCYAFKNNIGVDLDEELKKVMQKFSVKTDLVSRLEEISDLEYLLPKSYNQTYSITRYFQYVYMTPEVLEKTVDTEYLFQEHFSDGKLIALVSEDVIAPQKVLAQSKKWNDSRVLLLLPDRPFFQKKNIMKLLAVRELLGSKEFLEDNRVLEQELKLYGEDLLFEINAGLEKDFLPQNRGCRVIWNGGSRRFSTEKEFNTFLSEICGAYYNFSPKVNHELLNIQNVTGQYLKARNVVVNKLLTAESMEEYGKGTSPEALVYRTAFIRTGLRGKQFPPDAGTEHILKEIRDFIIGCAEEKRNFTALYQRIQGKEYGVRKGLIPLFLAAELMTVAGTPILYLQSKEVFCNADILNNVNENPRQYFLYLEQEDARKEAYLAELEAFFEIRENSVGKQERIRRLAEEMQKNYRALPKVVSYWKQFDRGYWESIIRDFSSGTSMRGENAGQEKCWQKADAEKLYEASEMLMTVLRKLDINCRELLFEKIPLFLNRSGADKMCAWAVELVFTAWSGRLQDIKSRLAGECLRVWGGREGESLPAYLKDWYEKQRDTVQNMVLSAKSVALWACLEDINGYDAGKTAAELAFAVTDIHIEDWSQETAADFAKALISAKEEIEFSAAAERQNVKKVVFTGREGSLVERYFQADETGIGHFLKNAIYEALEEFGDSMEPAQKAAVLVEALEDLLK